MRSLFWCGAVVTTVMAGGFYWAADYANRNPETVLGRGAEVFYRVGTEWNPAYRLGRAVAERNSYGLHVGASRAIDESAGAVVAARNTSYQFGVDCARRTEDPSGGCIIINEEEEARALAADECGSMEHGSVSAQVSVTVAAGALEECDVAQPMPTMPAVGEEKKDLAPAEMPYVEEAVLKEIQEFWMNFMTFGCFHPELATKKKSCCRDNDPACCPGKACPHANDADIEEQNTNDAQPERKMFQPNPDNSEGCPTCPGVDTMEFRPGEDAREGEFDPQPM